MKNCVLTMKSFHPFIQSDESTAAVICLSGEPSGYEWGRLTSGHIAQMVAGDLSDSTPVQLHRPKGRFVVPLSCIISPKTPHNSVSWINNRSRAPHKRSPLAFLFLRVLLVTCLASTELFCSLSYVPGDMIKFQLKYLRGPAALRNRFYLQPRFWCSRRRGEHNLQRALA